MRVVSRALILATQQISARAYEAEDDPNTILDEAEQAIFSIAEDRARQGFLSMRDIVQESLPKIELLFESKKLITGIPTGFTDLDQMTRGLQAGDLVIVAARPSMGKTSLVLNMAEHASLKDGRTVGFFSLEMSRQQVSIRQADSWPPKAPAIASAPSALLVFQSAKRILGLPKLRSRLGVPTR